MAQGKISDGPSFAEKLKAMDANERRLERLTDELAARTHDLAEAQKIAKLGFWRWTLDTNAFAWSEELYRLVGRDPLTFEVDLESTFSCLHPDDREETFDKLLLTVSDKKAYDHEYRVVKPDGEVIHFWSCSRPVLNAEGEVSDVHGICQEITDRVRAEAALRESEDHYSHAVELNPQISFTAEPDGSILEVGPRWLELTGISREETLGQGWAKALHPDDLPGTAEKWSACLLGGKPGDMEYRLRLRNGTYRWMRARAAPRFNAEGTIIRWYGAVEDIHDRKLAQERLRENEQRYRALIEGNASVVWQASSDGADTKGWGWDGFTGRPYEEGLALSWTAAIHSDDRQVALEAWEQSVKEGRQFDAEYRLKHASGDYRWVRDRAIPIRNADGSIREWVGMIIDTDDRYRFEKALSESEEFSRSILESSPDCIKVLDLDGRLRFMNEPGLRLMEIDDVHAVKGTEWVQFWPSAQSDRMRAAIEEARASRTDRFTGYCPTASGTPKWWDVLTSPILGPEDRPVQLLVISRDVTEAKHARDEVDTAYGRLNAVLESTTDNVIVIDREWRVTYMNERAEALVGRNGKFCVGKHLWNVYPEHVGSIFHQKYQLAMDRQISVRFEAFLLSLGVWLEVHAYPTPDGLSIFFRDITEARRAREEIAHLAHHDALTGLPNRMRFNQQLSETFSQADGAKVAALVLDLDRFKEINDTLGHPTGDALLQQIADRLRSAVQEAGMLARLGGDEFAVIQAVSASGVAPSELADRLISVLKEPFDVDGHLIRTGVSIGIAVASRTGQEPDELFKNADIALYQAKADGRGVHRLYEAGMHEPLQARQAMKQDLSTALDKGEFRVVYQPLVSLGANRISSFEALLRWQHPTRGTVSPAEFIPTAEETGLIVSIGEWVLAQACRDATTWPDDVSVAVNLSPVQFTSRSLPLRVAHTLAETGLAPTRLELEITESVLLQDSEANLALLHEIRALGVRVALDDFGTGFSSLSYLRRYPFDKIKIDRSFVEDIGSAKQSEAIIRAVTGLGHSLGMRTTAEGVETAGQLDWLRAEGCDEVQGYLISKPIAAEEVERLFGRRQNGNASAA